MIFKKIQDVFKNSITLTCERWQHIIYRHPELKRHQTKIVATLKIPDTIIEDDLNKKVRLYHKFDKQLNGYLVVIVETEKKFIITSYVSLKIKRGKMIWQNN